MRTNDRTTFVWLSVISLAVILLFVLGGIVIRNDLAGLKNQQLHTCERDNVQRAEDNASHYADYHVDSFVVQRFTVPTKTETPTQKRITAEFASTLHQAVAAKSWVPLTDCSAAVVVSGAAYKAPQPISFARGSPAGGPRWTR